jgi:hypothetical protein
MFASGSLSFTISNDLCHYLSYSPLARIEQNLFKCLPMALISQLRTRGRGSGEAGTRSKSQETRRTSNERLLETSCLLPIPE